MKKAVSISLAVVFSALVLGLGYLYVTRSSDYVRGFPPQDTCDLGEPEFWVSTRFPEINRMISDGSAKYRAGDYNAAISLYEQALHRIPFWKHEHRAAIALRLSRALYRSGDVSRATELIQTAIATCQEKCGESPVLREAIRWQSVFERDKGDLQPALALLESEEKMARKAKLIDFVRAEAMIDQGITLAQMDRRWDAQSQLLVAADFFQQLKFSGGYIRANRLLGIITGEQGLVKPAMEYTELALKAQRQCYREDDGGVYRRLRDELLQRRQTLREITCNDWYAWKRHFSGYLGSLARDLPTSNGPPDLSVLQPDIEQGYREHPKPLFCD